MQELTVNSKKYELDVDSDTPLLWVLRDTLNLTGTKYGCGIQQCGSCTVLVKGRPVRSCGVTLEEVAGKDMMQPSAQWQRFILNCLHFENYGILWDRCASINLELERMGGTGQC